jgi:hypothetical protein
MSSAEKVKDVLKDEVQEFLKNQGHTGSAAAQEFEAFYREVEPDVIEQMTYYSQTGDPMSAANLRILRDRLAIKAASVGLGIIQQERKAVAAIVVAVIRTAISFA